jgi:hypothetical protein
MQHPNVQIGVHQVPLWLRSFHYATSRQSCGREQEAASCRWVEHRVTEVFGAESGARAAPELGSFAIEGGRAGTLKSVPDLIADGEPHRALSQAGARMHAQTRGLGQ